MLTRFATTPSGATLVRAGRSKFAATITLFFIALYAGNTPANTCFDDASLLKTQATAEQRGTLIYIWSPRMVYSVQNMAVASQAATASGLSFVALHDMRVPQTELPPAQEASQALCSALLIQRDALRHFPSAFVVNASGIHPHPIVGAMPWRAWVSSIHQRLQQP